MTEEPDWDTHCSEMVEKAPHDFDEAKLILGLIADYCRANEQLPTAFASYLADRLTEVLRDPVTAQDALYLKKPSSARNTHEVRNYCITEAMLAALKADLSKAGAAKLVRTDLKLPLSPRRIIGIHDKYKDQNGFQIWLRIKERLKVEGTYND